MEAYIESFGLKWRQKGFLGSHLGIRNSICDSEIAVYNFRKPLEFFKKIIRN